MPRVWVGNMTPANPGLDMKWEVGGNDNFSHRGELRFS